MELSVEQVVGNVPLTIVGLTGKLDATNFEELIARVGKLYAAGTRYLLLDLSNLTFMGSSGLVAFHSITLLLRGQELPDPEAGWAAFRTMGHDQGSGPQDYVKILNPQPKIVQILKVTGMEAFYPIFSDREAALASFGA